MLTHTLPTRLLTTLAGASAVFALSTASALAHVTLENQQAPVGSYYKAVLKVPHGCKGSPTVKLRIQIPAGVISIKPQPKAGWKIDMVDANYPKAYTLHGAQVSSGVRELSWSGNLPDAYYEEFVFQAYLTSDLPAGTVVHFPVVQECEKGISRWIDTKEGADNPAPKLTIVAKP